MRGLAFAARAGLAAILLTCGLIAGLAGPAFGQEVSPENRARLEAMFEELAKNPANLDKTYEYAKFAAAVGDYEAAITAYERLLLFNPKLPRVQAELGVLYYRLGSFDTARAYLEQALEDEQAPPEVKARIDEFLNAIAAQQRNDRFFGSLTFGMRYQTNATFGPDGRILVFDIPVEPDRDSEAEPDFNAFAVARGRYVHDFGDDSGDFFAVDATLYGARQFNETDLDVEHFQVAAGPGLHIFPSESGPVLFRPIARLTYVRLDDESYNVSAGGGFRAEWLVVPETTLFTDLLVERREYYATKERENADTQDGLAYRISAGAIHGLTGDVIVRGEAYGGSVGADDLSEAYDEYGGSVGLTAAVASPLDAIDDMPGLAYPWTLSMTARYGHRRYLSPNPIVSTRLREDDEFRIDGTVAVPIADAWSVFGTVGYLANYSTIPNNDYDNVIATIGANIRF